jgi:HSP20 family protein
MLARRFDTLNDLFRRFEPELTDLFEWFGEGSSTRSGRMRPPMEVLRTDSDIVVRVELPGVDPESVDVTLQDRTLKVRAERRVDDTIEQGEYLRREFACGTFEGGLVLPSGIDPGKLTARYDGGILEIRVPHAADQAVKVPVEVGSGERKEQKELKAAS